MIKRISIIMHNVPRVARLMVIQYAAHTMAMNHVYAEHNAHKRLVKLLKKL